MKQCLKITASFKHTGPGRLIVFAPVSRNVKEASVVSAAVSCHTDDYTITPPPKKKPRNTDVQPHSLDWDQFRKILYPTGGRKHPEHKLLPQCPWRSVASERLKPISKPQQDITQRSMILEQLQPFWYNMDIQYRPTDIISEWILKKCIYFYPFKPMKILLIH